jgi:hypothetical protein
MRQRNHPQDQPTDIRTKCKNGSSAPRGGPPGPALQAVQIALDRRDNGGDVPTGDEE